MSANPVATPAATPEPAPAPAQGTPAPAAAPAAPQSEPQVKTFFSKKAAEAPKETPPDLSKLPPELQNAWKSMQGDATRKWQEISDARKAWEGERERERAEIKAEREAMQRNHDLLMEAVRGRNAPDGSTGQPDPIAQVQALKDEGRYDEAMKLEIELVKQAALAEVAPLRQEAQTQKNFAMFNNVREATKEQFPVVKEHWDYVQQTWEANTPTMNAVRTLATASPEMIRFFTPLAMVSIANEAQLKRVEPAYTAAVEKITQLEAKLAKYQARSVPPSLVSSSQVSRETSNGKGTLEERVRQSLEQLRGA